MYTSYGKANDRFGFEAKGTFKCAYKHDSVLTVIGAALIIVWIILILINVVLFFSFLYSGKAEMYSIEGIMEVDQKASAEHGDIVSAAEDISSGGVSGWNAKSSETGDSLDGPERMKMFSSGFIGMSVNSLATAFGIIMLIIFLAGFILMVVILRAGQNYDFKATEDKFIITYPLKMGKTVMFRYDDVLGIKWTERKFPFLPKCYDIDVKTRSEEYTFRVILTKLARVNGITETPFNIIRERAGLAENDRFYGV